MKLTVDQMLQQGVAAHNAGNPEEAERLYRAILQVQPKHPDANHNLGLIAVSMNQSGVALPLFKSAVKVNPNIEQFWLSYIDALIAERQFENAKQAIKQGKKKGVAKEKLKALTQQLVSVKAGGNLIQEPSQPEIEKLLNHYQNGQYGDAEKLAISLTQQFPRNSFCWKVLGGTLKALGQMTNALAATNMAIELDAHDSEAHSVKGVILEELGRLKEAEASYRQAIGLPSSRFTRKSAIFNNLGNTLKDLGRLEEAEVSLRQAIALNPGLFEAHSNLSAVLQELGGLEGAEETLRKAVALAPEFAEARNNLGNTLKELGRLEEAEASLRQAIALKPDFAEARHNLGIILFESRQYNLAAEQFGLINSRHSMLYAIRCSYLEDEKTVFYEKLDLLVNQGGTNAVVGSLLFCAEIKYGIKKPNPFCSEPIKYVVTTDLTKQYDFGNIFIKTVKDVLTDNSLSYKEQSNLTNGVQTAGNIFAQGEVPNTEIESIIHAEIEKYRIHFKDSQEGFIKSWPNSYEIKGWLVCMKSGGELAPHMHDTGWITGSIYINVPPKSKVNSGNLVLCLSDQEDVLVIEKSQQSIIDVVSGSLCLFPSSLHHYTVPFEESEDRIVLAFDVIPKN